MKIIDAHIHFGVSEGFDRVAQESGQANSVEFLAGAFADSHVVQAIAMGTRRGDNPAVCSPQTPDLGGKLDPEHYNQPDFIRYCCGVDSSPAGLRPRPSWPNSNNCCVYPFNAWT